MSIKITSTVSRQYASPTSGTDVECSFGIDVPAAGLDDPETLHLHIRQAIAVCHRLLDEEVARQPAGTGPGNGQANGRIGSEPRQGGLCRPSSAAVPATPTEDAGLRDRPPVSRKQLACIRRLASEIPGLDAGRLDVLARRLCGKTVAELRNCDAGRVIDVLREAKAGRVDLEIVLHGAGGSTCPTR